MLLEKDIVVSNKFKEWRSNVGPITGEKGLNMISPLTIHNNKSTDIKQPSEIILQVIEEVLPISSNPSTFSSNTNKANPAPNSKFIQNRDLDHQQYIRGSMPLQSSSNDTSPVIQLKPSNGLTGQPRLPRMSGSWKVTEATAPLPQQTQVKLFVTPQSSPILLRRSEPQPNTTIVYSPAQKQNFWQQTSTGAQSKSPSANLRENPILKPAEVTKADSPQILDAGPNFQPIQNHLEPKKKNLLDLPARMLNTPSRPQISGPHILKIQPEAYRPLLSSGFRDPTKRSSSPQAILERGSDSAVLPQVRESRPAPNAHVYVQPTQQSPPQFSAPIPMEKPKFASQLESGNSQVQDPRGSQLSWAKQSQSTATNWGSQPAGGLSSFARPALESPGDSRIRAARSAEHFRGTSDMSAGSVGTIANVTRSPQPSYSRNPLLAVPRF